MERVIISARRIDLRQDLEVELPVSFQKDDKTYCSASPKLRFKSDGRSQMCLRTWMLVEATRPSCP